MVQINIQGPGGTGGQIRPAQWQVDDTRYKELQEKQRQVTADFNAVLDVASVASTLMGQSQTKAALAAGPGLEKAGKTLSDAASKAGAIAGAEAVDPPLGPPIEAVPGEHAVPGLPNDMKAEYLKNSKSPIPFKFMPTGTEERWQAMREGQLNTAEEDYKRAYVEGHDDTILDNGPDIEIDETMSTSERVDAFMGALKTFGDKLIDQSNRDVASAKIREAVIAEYSNMSPSEHLIQQVSMGDVRDDLSKVGANPTEIAAVLGAAQENLSNYLQSKQFATDAINLAVSTAIPSIGNKGATAGMFSIRSLAEGRVPDSTLDFIETSANGTLALQQVTAATGGVIDEKATTEIHRVAGDSTPRVVASQVGTYTVPRTATPDQAFVAVWGRALKYGGDRSTAYISKSTLASLNSWLADSADGSRLSAFEARMDQEGLQIWTVADTPEGTMNMVRPSRGNNALGSGGGGGSGGGRGGSANDGPLAATIRSFTRTAGDPNEIPKTEGETDQLAETLASRFSNLPEGLDTEAKWVAHRSAFDTLLHEIADRVGGRTGRAAWLDAVNELVSEGWKITKEGSWVKDHFITGDPATEKRVIDSLIKDGLKLSGLKPEEVRIRPIMDGGRVRYEAGYFEGGVAQQGGDWKMLKEGQFSEGQIRSLSQNSFQEKARELNHEEINQLHEAALAPFIEAGVTNENATTISQMLQGSRHLPDWSAEKTEYVEEALEGGWGAHAGWGAALAAGVYWDLTGRAFDTRYGLRAKGSGGAQFWHSVAKSMRGMSPAERSKHLKRLTDLLPTYKAPSQVALFRPDHTKIIEALKEADPNGSVVKGKWQNKQVTEIGKRAGRAAATGVKAVGKGVKTIGSGIAKGAKPVGETIGEHLRGFSQTLPGASKKRVATMVAGRTIVGGATVAAAELVGWEVGTALGGWIMGGDSVAESHRIGREMQQWAADRYGFHEDAIFTREMSTLFAAAEYTNYLFTGELMYDSVLALPRQDANFNMGDGGPGTRGRPIYEEESALGERLELLVPEAEEAYDYRKHLGAPVEKRTRGVPDTSLIERVHHLASDTVKMERNVIPVPLALAQYMPTDSDMSSEHEDIGNEIISLLDTSGHDAEGLRRNFGIREDGTVWVGARNQVYNPAEHRLLHASKVGDFIDTAELIASAPFKFSPEEVRAAQGWLQETRPQLAMYKILDGALKGTAQIGPEGSGHFGEWKAAEWKEQTLDDGGEILDFSWQGDGVNSKVAWSQRQYLNYLKNSTDSDEVKFPFGVTRRGTPDTLGNRTGEYEMRFDTDTAWEKDYLNYMSWLERRAPNTRHPSGEFDISDHLDVGVGYSGAYNISGVYVDMGNNTFGHKIKFSRDLPDLLVYLQQNEIVPTNPAEFEDAALAWKDSGAYIHAQIPVNDRSQTTKWLQQQLGVTSYGLGGEGAGAGQPQEVIKRRGAAYTKEEVAVLVGQASKRKANMRLEQIKDQIDQSRVPLDWSPPKDLAGNPEEIQKFADNKILQLQQMKDRLNATPGRHPVLFNQMSGVAAGVDRLLSLFQALRDSNTAYQDYIAAPSFGNMGAAWEIIE